MKPIYKNPRNYENLKPEILMILPELCLLNNQVLFKTLGAYIQIKFSMSQREPLFYYLIKQNSNQRLSKFQIYMSI